MNPIPQPDELDRFAAAFTVLSRLFLAPPDAQALDRLRDPSLLAGWPLPSATAEEGISRLVASAAAGETAEDVRADHTALFVGPGMRAVPYESVHRSVEKLLFEQQTLEVRALYARLGLAAPRLNREPDDHIGLELEFVAQCCFQGLSALEAAEADQLAQVLALLEEFAADHLLVWGPDLMHQVTEGAATRFYAGVGRLGAAALGSLETVPWLSRVR